MNEALNKAIELSKLGIESYPIVAGGRTPYKGSNGQNDASKDIEELREMFKLDSNININLATSSLLVLDVDRHTKGENGLDALGELVERHGDFYGNTFWNSTPRSGFHFFFRTNGEKLNSKTDLKNGIEIITDQIAIAPSINEFGKYEASTEKTFKDIQPAPPWLIDMAKPKSNTLISTSVNTVRRKRTLAYFLDSMIGGAKKGNRNPYLTSMLGTMLKNGTDPTVAYNVLLMINDDYLEPPLETKEVNGIFKSIMKRETGGRR